MHGRKPKRKPKGYWSTLDHLRAVAKKYGCRKEFAKKSGSAYSAARKNGWIDEIFRGFEKNADSSFKWWRLIARRKYLLLIVY
ncbi:hypothetical protein BOW50_12300 [Solemya velum gill symbiont]|nr:hypothetical protein BOW50_12300 [Solemya velum gill symbiont]